MPFTVKEVQPTPNPNAVKFVLDRHVTQERMSFTDPSAATGHPLASRLFSIGGVTNLLFLGDFITVTKSAESKWGQMAVKVKRALAATDGDSA